MTAQVAGQAVICRYCGGSIYEVETVKVEPAKVLQVLPGWWTALVCAGCASVQLFAEETPGYRRQHQLQTIAVVAGRPVTPPPRQQ